MRKTRFLVLLFLIIFIFMLNSTSAYIPISPLEKDLDVSLKMGEKKVIDILLYNQNNYSINISDVVISNYDCAFGCPGVSLISYDKQIPANSTGIFHLEINSNIGDEIGSYIISIEYNSSGNIEETGLNINVKQNISGYLMCLLPYILILVVAIIVIFFILKLKKLNEQKYKRY